MMRAYQAGIVAAAMLLSGMVLAQGVEQATFSVDRFRPAMDREGLLNIEWAGISQPFNYDVTVWLGYQHEPLVLYERSSEDPTEEGVLVGNRLGANIVGAVSVHERLELGIDIPFSLYQDRGDGIGGALVRAGDELESAGMGDIRFTPKLGILSQEEQGLNIALLVGFTVPTASSEDAYLGEGRATFRPELAISGRAGSVLLATNLGAHIRTEETETIGRSVGTELLYGLGVGYDFSVSNDLPLEIDLTVHGALATEELLDDALENPMEIILGGQVDATKSWLVHFGVGTSLIAGHGAPDFHAVLGWSYSRRRYDWDHDGTPDDEDTCPLDPEDFDGFEDEDGCPDPDNDQDDVLDVADDCPLDPEDADGFEDRDGCPDPDNDEDNILDVDDGCPDDPEDFDDFEDEDGCPERDNDGDGLPDAVDDCPNETEDLDSFEDHDGCIDADNDQDGILDVEDACPMDAEDFDGDADGDGCPEEFTEVTADRIEIWESVHFETDSATIMERSYPLLDEVYRIIHSNPAMQVRIEGHTDSRASEEYNMRLSDVRAGSVREYLIRMGIEPERLTAVGFGESRPLADNRTRQGRADNRRVEFHIVER